MQRSTDSLEVKNLSWAWSHMDGAILESRPRRGCLYHYFKEKLALVTHSNLW